MLLDGAANAVITLILAALPPGETAQTPRCKGRPEVTGSCFVVHGRMSSWNGNPVFRIWPVGTTRMLGVRDTYDLPPNIALCTPLEESNRLYADFEVCPLAPDRPGHMRPVCVESATTLVLEVLESDASTNVLSVTRLGPEGCPSK